ncbi:cytochrome P450 [Clavulina sp. PMI_390]|nr:cytochrome P450 [Clavulina sp. PMI_390]
MSYLPSPPPLEAFAVSLILLGLWCWQYASSPSKLPPGPKGLPWIGQAFKIPKLHTHIYFTGLQKQFGDVVTVTALGQKVIVLNSYEAAFNILAKHGSIHCNRTPNPFLTRFMGLDNMSALINAGPDWKEGRRLYQALLNKSICRDQYAEQLANECQSFVLRAVEVGGDKDGDCDLIDAVMHKIFMEMTYGVQINGYNDPVLLNSIHATELASESLVPGKHLVNLIPFLQHLPPWIPFQSWRAEGQEAQRVFGMMADGPWQEALLGESDASNEPSFVRDLLRKRTPANEHLLKVTALSNMVAGTENTSGLVRAFVLAMLLHPKVQKKAQEEMDRVVGFDRLPTLEDQRDLPYLDAIIKEVMRWRPVAPLSVPTTPTREDVYGEHLIPADAIVVQNNWGISRDERQYPNPESFTPERWLVEDPPVDPRLWSFGVGRRICPGAAFAETLYITMFMTLLATVDIVPQLGDDGKPVYVDPSAPTTGRLSSTPLPFAHSLKARSRDIAGMLSDACFR